MSNKNTGYLPETKPGFFYGYIVVITTLIIMMVSWGVYFTFGVFFKPVLNEFGWDRAVISGAFSLSMIMQGVLGIVMGALADRIGPRIVLTLAGVIMGLGYILTSQVSEAWHFYLLQGVIVGIGIGGTIVPVNATIARWFAARRSMMTGIVLAGTGIGQLIVVPVANWLITVYDWRLTYIIVGSAILIVVVIGAQFVRRDPAEMGLVPYGEGRETNPGVRPVALELSLKEAVGTRQFWIVFAIFFCLGFYRLTIITHLMPHTTDLGISAVVAANILATTGGANIVGRIAMGVLADKIGDRRNFIIGFILMSAAMFWLMPATEAWMLYLFAVFFGFAHAGVGTSEAPLVASLFGLKSLGFIFGVIAVGITIGGAVGPVLAGYIFDITGSYQLAFLICAAIGIAAVILSVLIKPIKTNKPST